MSEAEEVVYDYERGTEAPWYRGWEITDEEREFFRATSRESREAKLKALRGDAERAHDVNVPTLDPSSLMPRTKRHDLASLSLFSGGGGIDLGFDRAGFTHVASYDTLDAAGRTLKQNRRKWEVFSGVDGDVRAVNWRSYRGNVDVLHGGPPCQPFSTAGRQRGHKDERNLLPEFVDCVLAVRPAAFMAENVPALAGPKFANYLRKHFYAPLERDYYVTTFRLSAHCFGVPQVRHRVFFVGFRRKRDFERFVTPTPTHIAPDAKPEGRLKRTLGAREALGLPPIGYDALAPTLRSTLTGPRHTTSILSSATAQKTWEKMHIWPNGVAATREAASAFPAKNGHFRLAVPDAGILQGFPESWRFDGAVYMALGQIGNSVAPPVAYRLAKAIAAALHG